jgi:4'-phosphopantetheinyl transferase
VIYDPEVTVWRIHLGAPAGGVPHALSLLSPDERARASSFRTETLRRRYILSHAALRQLLASTVDTHPMAVRFVIGPFGKPALAPEQRGGWSFNLTHSSDLALCAVAHDREVGIDLERVRPLDDPVRTGAGVLSPAELDFLRDQPPDRRAPSFFRLWVRHEALAKATGAGLAEPPDGIQILQPGSVTALDGTAWHVADLPGGTVPRGYVAALACEGLQAPRIRFRETQPGRSPFAM